MSETILIIDDDDDIREGAQLTQELGASWNAVAANCGVAGVLDTPFDPAALLNQIASFLGRETA